MLFSALLITASLLTQAQPAHDLSGTWTMIADRSGSPTQTPPVNSMTLRVNCRGDEVEVQWLSGTDKPETITYPLVPEPVQPSDPLAAGQQRAYWQGSRLVLERGGTISGQTVSMKQSLSLDPASNELVLERLVIVQHGYTLKGTQNYATVKDVFARANQ